jgi:hypothetical protein
MEQLRQLYRSKQGAGMLMFIMVFGFVSVGIIILGVASYAIFEHQASVRTHIRERSFHIAEAGINYYRWHLAHAPTDYTDGTGEPGPYTRAFLDKDGAVIGYYQLEITPPIAGTSIVTVVSTGWTIERPDITRTIRVRLGYPGLADYAFVDNGNMRFSQTTEVYGKIHANGGIEFNGQTDAPVQSARSTYDSNGTKNGVWGIGGPVEFWEFPVPEIDFGSITADLAALQELAESNGLRLTDSGDDGYYLEFQADGTVDVYRVTSVLCYYGDWVFSRNRWRQNVHCYDANNRTFLNSYDLDDISVIYVEDTVWVSGVVNGYVTVAAAEFPESPSNYKNIIIQNNLTYAESSSDDAIGLIAQGNIIVPRNVPNSLTIHAAALSQYGMIHRPYYDTSYSSAVRQNLFFFGSQISYEGGGWKWVNSSGTVINGFVFTNHTYDGNLLYYPPPGFPVGDTYELISWEEVE